MPMRALRGATTLENDTRADMEQRVVELMDELLERNGVAHDDLVSILFTATPDLRSMFPAEAARSIGLADVPLICAREIDVVGATPMCVRVLVHLETDRAAGDLRHVYLHGAKGLRDDLPG